MTLHFRTRRLVIFGKSIDVSSSFSDVLDDPTVGWRREKSGKMGTQITDFSGIHIVVRYHIKNVQYAGDTILYVHRQSLVKLESVT